MSFKITANFDADAIKRKILEQGKEAMKKKFTEDIKKLARPFGENPKISFTPNGEKGISVKVSDVSAELEAEIDKYIKSNSK